MSDVVRYAVADRTGVLVGEEMDTLEEALEAAGGTHAVIARHYGYEHSSLEHTPDGSDRWPPEGEGDMWEGGTWVRGAEPTP